MVVEILHQLNFLSLGGVEEKKASDFIGSHVGDSEKKTKAILKSAEGKVLMIDEAYGLDDDVYGKKVGIFMTQFCFLVFLYYITWHQSQNIPKFH